MRDPVLTVFERAAADHQHGAAEIETALVENLLALRSEWNEPSLRQGAALLLEAHPVMANLRCLARAVENTLGLVDHLEARWRVLCNLDRLLAENALPALEGRSRVLTLSRSSAVRSVLLFAYQRGWRGRVEVFDGAASGAGVEQALSLAAHGVLVSSQPDAAMANRLDEDYPGTLVAIGADAVSEKRVVNAIGSRALLELARARDLTSLLIADSGKNLADEEVDEILAAARIHQEAGPGRRWPVFEALPAGLLRHRVDEYGLHRRRSAAGAPLW